MALSAAAEQDNLCGGELFIRIVVPQRALLMQWKEAVLSSGFREQDIGLVSSLYSCPKSRKIIIYVINSARQVLAIDILDLFKDGRNVMLIADEMHHYISKENSRIFDFTLTDLFREVREKQYCAMGLSATVNRNLLPEKAGVALGEIIYAYSVSCAVDDKVITPFCIYNIAIRLETGEVHLYEELSDKITKAMAQLFTLYRNVMKDPGMSLQEKLATIRRYDSYDEDLLDNFMKLILLRRAVIKKADKRLNCLLALIEQLEPLKPTIIFTEFIEQAEDVFSCLSGRLSVPVVLYHSRMGKTERNAALGAFRDGSAGVLVACKALDEGIDVPGAQTGIFLSNTEGERQRIQRAGRILRRSNGKSIANLYYLFADGTIESPEFLADYPTQTTVLNALYTGDEFITSEYSDLYRKIRHQVSSKANKSQLSALDNAYRKGMMRFDFLLPPKEIENNIRTADETSLRNYWILMRQMKTINTPALLYLHFFLIFIFNRKYREYLSPNH